MSTQLTILLQKCNKLSLRKKIGLLIAVILTVSFICLTYLSVSISVRNSKEKITAFSIQEVDTVSQTVSNTLERIYQSIRTFGADYRLQAYLYATRAVSTRGLEKEISAVLDTILDANSYLDSVGLYKTLDSSTLFRGDYPERTASEVYEEYSSKGTPLDKSTYMYLSTDSKSEKPILTLYRNMSDPYDSDVLSGILILRVNLERLCSDYVLEPTFTPLTTVLIDSNGTILSEIAKGEKSPYTSDLTERSNVLMIEDTMVVYQRIEPWGLITVSEIPKNYLTGEANSYLQLIFVSIGLICIFSLSVGKMINDRLQRPIRKLDRAMDAFLLGNPIPISYQNSGPEMEQIFNKYNRVIDQFEDQLESVREEEQQAGGIWKTVYDSQINPLLWDTITAIQQQAETDSNQKTKEKLGLMSDYYRLTFQNQNEEELVDLSQELEHIKKYLELQEVCSKIHTDVDIEIEESLLKTPIPRITLQPLIENTILHGFGSAIDQPVQITIRANGRGEEVYITISDNGSGMTAEEVQELNNMLSQDERESNEGASANEVHRRIMTLVGEDYGLFYKMNQTGGVSVLIHLHQ